MKCSTSPFGTANPFAMLRRDFERQLGMDTPPCLAGMSVHEYADRWVVSVDVPGLTENEIHVTFEDGTLVVEGERKAPSPEASRELFNDRAFTSFRRVLRVREPVAADSIDAELKNGVLTLTVRRAPEVAPARISIRSSSAS